MPNVSRRVLTTIALTVGATALLAGCTSAGDARPTGPGAPSSPTPSGTRGSTATPTGSADATAGGPSAGSSAPGTLAAPDGSPTAVPPVVPSGTVVTTVAPVTVTGALAAGWSARDGHLDVDCSAGTRSPVARSGGVLACSPSAASALACWRADVARSVYCLLDARGRTVVRYGLAGAFPAAGPTELEPQPLALNLTGGTRCSASPGGASARLASHPDWVPFYFCGSQDQLAVWGPPDSVSAGITRGDGPWTVDLARGDGSVAPRATTVARAYYVATAS